MANNGGLNYNSIFQLSKEHLHELNCGTYQADLARGVWGLLSVGLEVGTQASSPHPAETSSCFNSLHEQGPPVRLLILLGSSRCSYKTGPNAQKLAAMQSTGE